MNGFFVKFICVSLLSGSSAGTALAQTLGNYKNRQVHDHQLVFETSNGSRLSLKAYSDHVVRVQAIKKGEVFFKDDHYEMVASHLMTGSFQISNRTGYFEVTTGQSDGLLIRVYKTPVKLEFYDRKGKMAYVKDQGGITWSGTAISTGFVSDINEHFCGLGHQSFGLVPSIDLKGQVTNCNYGSFDYNDEKGGWPGQAFLTVPFYLSSKGYGVFLNSTFAHEFNFGKEERYQFKIDTHGFEGQMDYFFIAGPQFSSILDRYTQLTGRPRMPQRSIFGLQLSDKGAPLNEGAAWWENKIKAHRDAGYPIDHIVNDNRWRAGTGGWSGSWFEWDKSRYPDPVAYEAWCRENGLTMTLDLNRNNTSSCEGWKTTYNLSSRKKIKESFSIPDYSSPEVRHWLWSVFWKKSFNPALKYPGNAIWMDEIDELKDIPDSTRCADGRSWAENRNYYPFLVAKAVVQEGWDNKNKTLFPGIGEAERPFAWCRGMVAGGQRYATHWSGDLKCSYDWMKETIRGMQSSGLSGFPYFNHDAGGFRDPGPDDAMYMQWSLAMGSFSPIWRPHGVGKNTRWPLDRTKECQAVAMKYAKLRYEMMPYIYTSAYQAYAHGTPMARAMVFDYQYEKQAWTYDLQYLWGSEMLVAPQTASRDSVLSIWLPPGQNWFNFWTDEKLKGGQVIQYHAIVGELPVFVKEGAIIPKYAYAQSTFWMKPGKLILEVYPGKDGRFILYEDDGVTEKYKTRNEKRLTTIYYNEKNRRVVVKAALGNYAKAPLTRSYEIVFHGAAGTKRHIQTGKFSINRDVMIQL